MARHDLELYGAYNRARIAQLGGRVIDVDSRERRDPTAATLPLSYQTPGAPMMAEWDAGQAYRWAYIANVWVYACVRAVATDLAGLPFRAGADPAKPNDYNPNARLAQLLGPPPAGPAPKLSARRLWAWSIAQRIVTGRFAWELELEGQRIAALWPLVSDKLKAIPSERGTEWFRAFEYGRQDRPTRLRPDQVFYAWNPSQNDFRQPESALQAARLDISVAVMQDRYDYAFLKNDARPAAIVTLEAFAERAEFDAFKDQFRGEYAGPDNAGKTHFHEVEGAGDEGVAGAIAVTTLGLSQKDAEFIRRYESKVRGICVGLGVPMSRLDASGRTFSNADAEGVHYWTNVRNLAMDLQDDVNLDLAPRLGSEVGWFDFSGVKALQDPPKYQQVGLPALVSGGILTQNEGRAELGLPGVAGGDTLVDPMAAALASTGLAAQPDPVVAAQSIVDAANELITATVTDAVNRTVDNVELRHPAPVVDHEVRRARIWRAVDAQARALERSWERRWRAEFRRQEVATIKRLTGKRGRQALGETRDAVPTPEGIFDPTYWRGEADDLAQGLYEAVFAVGGARLAERFGLAFDLEAPYAQDFIAARANRLAGQVTETTYEAIKEQLRAGVAAGEDIDTIAARVRHVFNVASESRATTIARTEVISAFNGSATQVALELGGDLVGGQEWIATRDARVRASHAEADGQVVALDAAFNVGGWSIDYPGGDGPADEVVNCRCTVAFLTPEEMAGRAAPRGEVRMVSIDDANRLAVRVALGQIETTEAVAELAA